MFFDCSEETGNFVFKTCFFVWFLWCIKQKIDRDNNYGVTNSDEILLFCIIRVCVCLNVVTSYRVVPLPVHYDDVRRARCIIDRYPLRRRRSRPGNWTPSRIIDNCPACLPLSVLPLDLVVCRSSGKWRGMTVGIGSKGIDCQSTFFLCTCTMEYAHSYVYVYVSTIETKPFR